MNQDDYDRILGLVRDQCKPELLRFVRILRQNGYSKTDMGLGLVYLGQGLADELLSAEQVTGARLAGDIERRRGALAEFHQPPTKDTRQPR